MESVRFVGKMRLVLVLVMFVVLVGIGSECREVRRRSERGPVREVNSKRRRRLNRFRANQKRKRTDQNERLAENELPETEVEMKK